MLQAISGISTMLFVAVALSVGVRLILLARRTHGLPERVFGWGLTLLVGLGYPLVILGRTGLSETPDLAGRFIALGTIAMSAGWTAIWIFTQRVFRPDSRVAAAVCVAAIAGTIGFTAANIANVLAIDDPAALDMRTASFLGTPLLAMASYLWGAYESFRYHAMMRKRLTLGMADPVVTNRFLLWGVVMLASFTSNAVPVAGAAMGLDPIVSPWLLLPSAAAGLACAAALVLAFLPPRAYLQRLRTPRTMETAANPAVRA